MKQDIEKLTPHCIKSGELRPNLDLNWVYMKEYNATLGQL